MASSKVCPYMQNHHQYLSPLQDVNDTHIDIDKYVNTETDIDIDIERLWCWHYPRPASSRRSLIHSHIYSLFCSLTHSLIHSHLLTLSLTHPRPHSLTPIFRLHSTALPSFIRDLIIRHRALSCVQYVISPPNTTLHSIISCVRYCLPLLHHAILAPS